MKSVGRKFYCPITVSECLYVVPKFGLGVYGVGLRPFACWDCKFQSHQMHESVSVVRVVCCQVEVSASS